VYIYIKVTSKHARIRLLRCIQIATPSVPYFRSFTLSNTPRVSRLSLSTVRAHLAFFCTHGALSHNHSLTYTSAPSASLLSSVHMAPSRGRNGNSLLCGSVKACFYIYIYNIYIYKLHLNMRVFACYVVSKFQRHRCPTFGALRPRTQRTNGQLHFYIYRYSTM
jgi:hypothetical protein